MDVGKIGLFQLAERRLAWADRRQGVLAQNIANADTPGWKARDVKPFAQHLAQAGTALARTDPGHLAPTPSAAAAAQIARGERSPDGNGISLDEQLAKVADTETIHDMTGDLYKKYLGFFRLAIGR